MDILLLLGIYGFIDALMHKWGVWLFLERKASESNSRWVYNTLNCEFCRMFHLVSFIVTIFYFSKGIEGLGVMEIALPFVITGLIKIIKE